MARLQQFPKFINQLSEKTLDSICMNMEDQSFIAGENIFEQDQHQSLSIHLLIKGQGNQSFSLIF